MEGGDQPRCRRDSTREGPRWAQLQRRRLLPKKTPLRADLSPALFFFLFDQKAAKVAGQTHLPPPAAGGSGTDPEGLQEPPGGTGKGGGTWGCGTLGHRLPQRRWGPRDEPLLLLRALRAELGPNTFPLCGEGPERCWGAGGLPGVTDLRGPLGTNAWEKTPLSAAVAPSSSSASPARVLVALVAPSSSAGAQPWSRARPGDAARGERGCCGNILVSPAGI